MQALNAKKANGDVSDEDKAAIEDALNFLKEDVPAETIAKCVNLPLEEVLKLKEKIA